MLITTAIYHWFMNFSKKKFFCRSWDTQKCPKIGHFCPKSTWYDFCRPELSYEAAISCIIHVWILSRTTIYYKLMNFSMKNFWSPWNIQKTPKIAHFCLKTTKCDFCLPELFSKAAISSKIHVRILITTTIYYQLMNFSIKIFLEVLKYPKIVKNSPFLPKKWPNMTLNSQNFS